MKKYLTPCLAVLSVVAIVLCFVCNGQKGDLQKTIDSVNEQLKATEAKVTEAEAAKAEVEAKLTEAEAAKAEIEGKLAEAEAAKTEAETKLAESEGKVTDLEKKIEEAAAAAAAAMTEKVEETVAAVTEKVEETVAAAAETAEAVVAEVAGEPKVMTHAEYIAAENDSEVLIESYVQGHQSWWDNKVTVYLQSEDGAYFAYEMACSEEDAAKLLPGQKIRVKGYKTEWAGEVEIASGCTFEFVESEPWVALATDVTALLAKPELADHMNEFVAVKGATIVAQENGEAFNYKNPEEKKDDLYFAVEVDGAKYNFCVESYLCGKDTDVYKAVEGLKVGDVVDIEGFLYWYNGANLQATSLIVK